MFGSSLKAGREIGGIGAGGRADHGGASWQGLRDLRYMLIGALDHMNWMISQGGG